MGQGSDSCENFGGDEYEHDQYAEGLAFGVWIQRTGEKIKVSQMTLKHLHGAKRVAQRAVHRSNFTDSKEMWQSWVDLFDDEIYARSSTKSAPAIARKAPEPVRGKTIEMVCHCKAVYTARTADISRGWGLSCSKRCAAIRRDYGRPAAKPKK